jgi:HEPN domain-containing protein
MPSPDQVARVLAEWVEKAEHDLQASTSLLELGDEAPTDVICFHAQQCRE